MDAAQIEPEVFKMTPARWRALEKSAQAHKHRHGHVAVIAGPLGQGGAARLSARGALRIGAGLVSVVCQPDALVEHATQLNAIMIKPYAHEETLATHLQTLAPKALCIGPNLGLGRSSQRVLAQALSCGLPGCIDADAITLLSDASLELPAISNPQSVLTPHEGELRRFIPEVFAQTACRLSLAQAAAQKAGCVVLFKGAETIVAAPQVPAVIVSSKAIRHTSWLATAGSGDVLAGFISGLLARGFTGREAASIAAELHFRCAEAFGPGLIAEDLPEILPRVLAALD